MDFIFLKHLKDKGRNSLTWKMILYILLFSSFFTFLATTVQLFQYYQEDIELIESQMELIEKSYLKSLSISLWEVDKEKITTQLKGVLNLSDIQFVSLQERTKELSFSMGKKSTENIISRQFPLKYSKSESESIFLGNLFVIATKDNARQRILNKLFLILFTQAVKTFCVSFCIFCIIYFLLTRHLITIAEHVSSSKLDIQNNPLKLNRKLPGNAQLVSVNLNQDSQLANFAAGGDELDQLVTAINKMNSFLFQKIEALQDSEKRYQDLYNNAPDMYVSVCAKTTNVLDCNQTIVNELGYSKEEIIGQHVFNLYMPDSLKHAKTVVFQQFQKTGTVNGEEMQLQRKDGSPLDVSLNVTAIRDKKGNIIRSRSVWRDITGQKKIEAQLYQAQKMESIGTLAGGIAHDFNNLLYPIIGFSEMLKEDLPPDSPEYESAQEIFNAGRRGGELVKQILAFSRQSEHKLSPVRFQKILAEVLKLTRSTIPSDIEIHQDIQKDCSLVMAEATQLHQIAMNLITNAYHAVEKTSGEISIQLKEIMLDNDDLKDSPLQPGQYVMLSVSDNGVGIPREIRNNIFEPYFTTKEKGKGTGLGLAVVYGILTEHKGDIKVYSEEGKGTTFNVYLPLMKKSDETISTEKVLNKLTGTERILLVDDEESVVRLEKQMLERLGYDVSALSNSLEALKTFNSNPDGYDLVISDMAMPNMTGDQLAKELMSIRPDIPIVICTGFSERINKEQAEANKVKGFLMKPVVKFEMAQMVRKVLDEAKV